MVRFGMLLLGGLVLGVPTPVKPPARDLPFHGRVPPSDLKVSLAPAAEVAREGNILVLTVRVKNDSREEVRATVAHEWHGGLWPPTGLYASVGPEKGQRCPFVPAYLAGEDPGLTRATALPCGESVELKVRMDWPGTGSKMAAPLVNGPGAYTVELLLVFEAGGKKQYVTSGPTMVRLPAK